MLLYFLFLFGLCWGVEINLPKACKKCEVFLPNSSAFQENIKGELSSLETLILNAYKNLDLIPAIDNDGNEKLFNDLNKISQTSNETQNHISKTESDLDKLKNLLYANSTINVSNISMSILKQKLSDIAQTINVTMPRVSEDVLINIILLVEAGLSSTERDCLGKSHRNFTTAQENMKNIVSFVDDLVLRYFNVSANEVVERAQKARSNMEKLHNKVEKMRTDMQELGKNITRFINDLNQNKNDDELELNFFLLEEKIKQAEKLFPLYEKLTETQQQIEHLGNITEVLSTAEKNRTKLNDCETEMLNYCK